MRKPCLHRLGTFFGETAGAAGIMRCPNTLDSSHCSKALAGAP